MKAKIVRGAGFRGVLDYAFGEHKSAEIVGGNLAGICPRELAAEFGVSRRMRPDVAKPVWHCSLALPLGETISNGCWRDVVDGFMSKMGLSSHPYTAVKHGDTEHQHVHIIASRIRFDGELWLGKWDVRKAIDTTQLLERQFGLVKTAGFEARICSKNLKKAEIEKSIRTGEAPVRTLLQEILSAALETPCTVFEFIDRVEAGGVLAVPAVASTGRLSGFSFQLQGVAFKGSQLGKKYSWSGLQRAGVTYEQGRDGEALVERAKQARARAVECQNGNSAVGERGCGEPCSNGGGKSPDCSAIGDYESENSPSHLVGSKRSQKVFKATRDAVEVDNEANTKGRTIGERVVGESEKDSCMLVSVERSEWNSLRDFVSRLASKTIALNDGNIPALDGRRRILELAINVMHKAHDHLSQLLGNVVPPREKGVSENRVLAVSSMETPASYRRLSNAEIYCARAKPILAEFQSGRTDWAKIDLKVAVELLTDGHSEDRIIQILNYGSPLLSDKRVNKEHYVDMLMSKAIKCVESKSTVSPVLGLSM